MSSRPNTNLVGEAVRFRLEVLRLPRFRDEFAGFTAETTLVIRAHWREDGRTYLTLQVKETGVLVDNMALEWVTVQVRA